MRIGIDGYNIALPAGTGVASYGVALANAIRGMGHGVTGVFGLAVDGPAALRELRFFDALQRPPQDRRTGLSFAARWAAEAVRPFAPIALTPVPQTGAVETAVFADRFPRFDRLLSHGRLFGIAHRHHARTGRFTTVTMPDPPDIMHWTYPVPVRMAGARNIYTIHDLVPLKLPYATLDRKAHYHALIRDCIARADHVCTVSERSRVDVLDLFGADPARVTNSYQAVPDAPVATDAAADAAVVEGVYGLTHRGYFLFYGAIEPKKNVDRLIEAHLATGTRTPLVIVGRPWEKATAARLLEGAGAHDRPADSILRLEYLPRRLLLQLVRGARAVTFPSLYEGFGLPVLEAMAMGTPVLSSITGSIPEVAGDAAILVDPYSVSGIADGLRRLDGDADLRARLSAAGVVQAALFSEARYRQRLAALYAAVTG